MELYLIIDHYRKVVIEKLEIIKETPKQIVVKDNKSLKTTIRKHELNYVQSDYLPYIFCEDIQKGKDLLYDYYNKLIENCKNKITSCEISIEDIFKAKLKEEI